MILPSDKTGLLILADWYEEYGTSYDVVKANAIRNFNFSLEFRRNYGNKEGEKVDCFALDSKNGQGRGDGAGCFNGFSYSFGYALGSGGDPEGNECFDGDNNYVNGYE